MPGLRAAGLAALCLAGIAGCATIAGLSDLQKDDCAFGCDGGDDGLAEGQTEEPGPDADSGGGADIDAPVVDAGGPRDVSILDVPHVDSPGGVCTAGHTRCTDAGVETCQPSGQWGGPSACSGQVCIDGGCTGVCAPGQVQCSGNGVETCASDGQWGAPVSCGSSTCVGGQCTGSCAQGQTQCSGNGVQTCDGSGQWGAPMPCSGQACVNGACSGVCEPGQVTCSGTSVQTCDATGNWQTSQTCPVACCNAACVDTTSDPNNCGGCGVTCGTGYACGGGFTAFTGAQPPGWTANGNAAYDATDNAAQLTDPTNSESGNWIYDNAIYVDSVTVQFDFYIGGGTGADGMGLMFETNGSSVVGGGFGGLGITGFSGFGVEIDEYDNMSCLDDSANHIGIDTLDPCASGIPNSQVINDSPGITVADGNWHTMVVQVANGAFTVTADGNVEFSAYTPSGWANGNYYLGFGGGTGGLNNYHLVRNVNVSFASPHCF
ncbi:MAG TPA: hypothetical protein VF765_22475 [Polyangiaceae bacterium]